MALIQNARLAIQLDERRRNELRRQENQDATRALQMMNRTIASTNTIVNSLAEEANDSQNLDELNIIKEEMVGQKTGIDLADDYIDAELLSVNNKINHLDTLKTLDDQFAQIDFDMGKDRTEGGKQILANLRKTYAGIADNLNKENKDIINERIKNAKDIVEINSYLGMIDADRKTEGMQFRNKDAKDEYETNIARPLQVAKESGRTDEVLTGLRQFYPNLAQQEEDRKTAMIEFAQGVEDEKQAEIEARILEGKKRTLQGLENELVGVQRNLTVRGDRGSSAQKLAAREIAAMNFRDELTFGKKDADLEAINYEQVLKTIASTLAELSNGKDAEQIKKMKKDFYDASIINNEAITFKDKKGNIKKKGWDDVIQDMITKNIKTKRGMQSYGRELNAGDDTAFRLINVYQTLINSYKQGEIKSTPIGEQKSGFMSGIE